jgi:hypothetical protein
MPVHGDYIARPHARDAFTNLDDFGDAFMADGERAGKGRFPADDEAIEIAGGGRNRPGVTKISSRIGQHPGSPGPPMGSASAIVIAEISRPGAAAAPSPGAQYS